MCVCVRMKVSKKKKSKWALPIQFISADRRQIGFGVKNVRPRQFDSLNHKFRLKCPNRFPWFSDISIEFDAMHDSLYTIATLHCAHDPMCMTNQSSKLSDLLDLSVHRIIFDNSHFEVTAWRLNGARASSVRSTHSIPKAIQLRRQPLHSGNWEMT